jgi:transcriptional regulator with XRE-family HTH domain
MKLSPDLTDLALLDELGRRLAQRRIDQGLSQAELAARCGVARRTIERLEAGTSIAFVAVLRIARELGLIGSLDAWLPESAPSPIALLEAGGRRRKRAPRARAHEPATPWRWGN